VAGESVGAGLGLRSYSLAFTYLPRACLMPPLRKMAIEPGTIWKPCRVDRKPALRSTKKRPTCCRRGRGSTESRSRCRRPRGISSPSLSSLRRTSSVTACSVEVGALQALRHRAARGVWRRARDARHRQLLARRDAPGQGRQPARADRARAVVEAGTVDLYRLEKDDNRVFEFDAAAQTWTAFRDGWAWRWGEYIGSGKGGSGAPLGTGATERWRECARLPADCHAPRASSEATDGPGSPKPVGNRGGTWRVAQIQDPFGNTIDFSYLDGCGCNAANGATTDQSYACPHLPREISFGTSVVTFAYEPRPDSSVSARDGVARRHGSRLTGITTAVVDGTSRRQFSRYRVSYAEGSPSVVQQIDHVAADNATRRLLTTTIDQAATRFAAPRVLGGFERLNGVDAARAISVNFNGVAYPDLVVISPSPSGDSYTVLGYRNSAIASTTTRP